MQLEPRDLKRWMERMEKRMTALERAVRKIPIETGGGGAGTRIKFVRPDEDVWRDGSTVEGSLLNRSLQPIENEEPIVIKASLTNGYFFKGLDYTAIHLEGIYQLLGPGTTFVSGSSQSELLSGGITTIRVYESDVTVHHVWGEGWPGEPVSSSGDIIGADWNDGSQRWEVTVALCLDELVESEEEE